MAALEYVERRDGGYYVAGTRVSLASIVYEFRAGASPEAIREDFPVLSLDQVYGAIAFYLGHQPEALAYLAAQEAKWQDIERRAVPASPDLQRRIEEAHKRLLTTQT